MNQPPEAAVKFFEAKGLALTWNWHDQWQDAHSRAFTVAKLARLDILQDIRDGVSQALAAGDTEQWFQKRLGALLQQKGWWGKKFVVGADGQAEVVQEGSPRRLSTIYRTNLQSAYMAGRWQQFAAEAKEAPYVQYIAVMDGRTRPSHARFNGKVFRIDSPAWQVIAPPLGFNCRCRIRNLDAGEMKQRGLKAEEDVRIEYRQHDPLVDARTGEWDGDTAVQRGISIPDASAESGRQTLWADRGWDYNPGEAGLAHLRQVMADRADLAAPALARAAIEELVSGPEFARWFAKPEGNHPLVTIPPGDAEKIGARVQVALLSPETAIKQRLVHPEITAGEYARAQDVIDRATGKAQDTASGLIYIREEPAGEGGGHVLVVKATKTGRGLWVTSYRRLSRQEAERESEIARLLDKGKG